MVAIIMESFIKDKRWVMEFFVLEKEIYMKVNGKVVREKD